MPITARGNPALSRDSASGAANTRFYNSNSHDICSPAPPVQQFFRCSGTTPSSHKNTRRGARAESNDMAHQTPPRSSGFIFQYTLPLALLVNMYILFLTLKRYFNDINPTSPLRKTHNSICLRPGVHPSFFSPSVEFLGRAISFSNAYL